MDFDPRMISMAISILTFVFMVIGFVVNKLATDKIANNHLAHIAEDLQTLKKGQDLQGEEIKNLQTDVSYIKGKEENNNKIIDLLKNTLNNE